LLLRSDRLDDLLRLLLLKADLPKNIDHLFELRLMLIGDLSEHSSGSMSGGDDRTELAQLFADCTLFFANGALKRREINFFFPCPTLLLDGITRVELFFVYIT
jgi:hypothetical protein